MTRFLADKHESSLGLLGRFFLFLLVVFLIVFPKGGLKVSDIPLTWGYLLLGFSASLCFFPMLARLKMDSHVAKALGVSLFFPLAALLMIQANGFLSFGYFVSFLFSFLFMPLFFLFSFHDVLRRVDQEILIRWITGAVFVVAVYGIFLFAYKYATGNLIEIPYLTVNVDDLGGVAMKNNDRAGVMKLVSTYNNGNIFGVSVLMLLPLFAKNRPLWQTWVVKLALLLTLSRTVWVGLVAYELLNLFFGAQKLTLKKSAISAVSIPFLAYGAYVLLGLMGKDSSFLMDSSLGGRSGQLDVLDDWEWISSLPYTAVSEMVYFSIFRLFGLLGLFLYLLWLFAPALIGYVARYPRAAYHAPVLMGIVLYWLVSASDGAIMLIPVMAIYWFLVAFYLTPSVEKDMVSAN